MEFWGIEIKPGKPFIVEQEDGYLIHMSQIALGDLKKVGDENVQVYVEVLGDDDMQKLLLGNLSQKIPQVSLDLMLDRDFIVSHECKSSSVFIIGYKTIDPMNEELDSEFDSEDEEIPMDRFKSELEKSNANGLNDQKANNPEADESDSEDESDSDEIGSDDDEDDSEEEEESPVKVAPPSKKRPNGGEMNNNTVASKKAKVASQQKGGHKGHKCGGVHPKRN